MKKKLQQFINLFSLLLCISSYGQTHIPQQAEIGTNCSGYYEYLPENYNYKAAQKYPLIIFLHGADNLGNGTTDIDNLLSNGVPKIIDNGSFPKSLKVGNQNFQFVVVSPQFKDWPTTDDVKRVINIATTKYNVDKSRIYLTGPSMGGGVIWDYTGESLTNALGIAAIVPVSGLSDYTSSKVKNIADGGLAVWATHNKIDNSVDASKTIGYVNAINALNPVIPAKITIFDTTSHDAWTRTYDTSFKEDNMHIYRWMLQYKRAEALPVALTGYNAYLAGKYVNIEWSTSQEINHHHFVVEKSIDGSSFRPIDTVYSTGSLSGGRYGSIDKEPFSGTNYYRVLQVDEDGNATVYNILNVKVTGADKNIFVVYPNPAKNEILLKLNTDENEEQLQVMLYSMKGELINSWKFQKNTRQWNQRILLSSITDGSYVLKVIGKQTLHSQIIVKN